MNAARSSWKEDAIRTLVKQGPWACLAILVLSCVGYEIRWFIHSTGASVASYVQQSGENIKELNSAVTLLSANQAAIGKQVDRCSQLLEEVQVTHRTQIAQSESITNLLHEAHKMMAPVPAKHDEQIRVLGEIRDKLHVTSAPTSSVANP